MKKHTIRRAVFPGTFDPMTLGHIDIINRALPMFDEIIVAIGTNTDKKRLFDLQKRLGWIREIFKDNPKIVVDHYPGLTADFCHYKEANYILRGIRNVTDFEYEYQIAQVNRALGHDVETIFMMPKPEFSAISSKFVRDVIIYGGDYKKFVHDAIQVGE